MAPQLFIKPERWEDATVRLNTSEIHYLRTVMRLSPGDQLVIADGTGSKYRAIIQSLEKRNAILLRVEELGKQCESPLQMTLLPCLPRSSKMDVIVQKTTELGVHALCPLVSQRSFQPASVQIAEKWRQRWQKIAEEAARQAGRNIVPRILPVQTLTLSLQQRLDPVTGIVLWEDEPDQAGNAFWETRPHSGQVQLIVGPEGGLAENEIALARSCGWQTIGLGPRILRAETAAIVITALVQFCWGDL
ncbi:16S rRNA (uracil(1498)-N(3))-methyltransferase [bacterium]|nr:16S rRNA (uracil(1498)-N(3))-methyltransferase [bacterium]